MLWKRIGVWAVFVVIALASLVIVRGILLDNARKTGNEMAHRYSVDGEKNTAAYETLMKVGSDYIDKQLSRGEEPEEWIQDYLKTIGSVLGSSVIDPYLVIDGRILAANPWEGDSGYDAESTQWYQAATEAAGEIIYTDGYQDAITGETVITIAKKGAVRDSVLAFDIFPEQFRREIDDDELPEGSSYYLCDSSGLLLYEESSGNVSREEFQNYIDALLGEIAEGSFTDSDAYIHSVNGEKLAAYYDVSEQGWISIITIPYDTLLRGAHNLSLWYTVILGIYLVTLIAMSIREMRINRVYRRTNDTVRVLGNSYYAIYRVDFSGGTYEMIKGSDYVRQRIPARGDYQLLLKTAGEIMPASVLDDFSSSFSLENIRRLVAGRTRDYGGDFPRLFGDEYRWVNVKLLFDESLDPEEAVLCFREVDEEKKMQLRQMQLLKESLNAAKESEESKNLFFSNMSHDMRTPLNAIIGLTELAKKHVSDPVKIQEYIEKIDYSGRHLLGLINDILEMSRMEHGVIPLDNRHFQMKKCIEDCAGIFREQAEMEGKKFVTDIDIQAAEVYGDSFRLTQVLNNLLSNAVKFTSEGDTISLQVRESEQKDFRKYQIVIRDTGAGMSEDFLDKLFVPYARETKFGTRDVKGTGLGMPITKNIISRMNGAIAVQSTLGEGTVFTVTLSFKAVAEEADEKNDEKIPAGQPKRKTASWKERRFW